MKKRIMALAMAVAMVFTLGVTVKAESPTAATVDTVDGLVSAAEYAQKAATAFEGATASEVNGMIIPAVDYLKKNTAKATLLMVIDLEGTPGQEVTYKDSSIKAGDHIMVLHWISANNAEGGSWKVESCKVEEGAVKFTPSSFSPFAIAKYTPAAAPAAAATSSKWGQTMSLAALVALLSAMGIALCTKKYRA